jgi:hypothetical protein
LARFRGSPLLPKTPSPFPKTIGVLQGDRTCGQRPTGEPVSSGGVSQVIGGGNTSALHPAFMFNQIWRSRVVLPPEPELKELVHEIAAATKSQQLLQQMLEELRGCGRISTKIAQSGYCGRVPTPAFTDSCPRTKPGGTPSSACSSRSVRFYSGILISPNLQQLMRKRSFSSFVKLTST